MRARRVSPTASKAVAASRSKPRHARPSARRSDARALHSFLGASDCSFATAHAEGTDAGKLERSKTLFSARHEGLSSSLLRARSLETFKNPSSSPYFKRRARNWRARWLRVNALASRPGRSRFAACVRAFATRGCVRGGLSRWASGVAWPSAFLGPVSLFNARGGVQSLRS